MIQRIKQEFLSIVRADGIILNYPDVQAAEGRVNLHYYHAELQNPEEKIECNLGDYLSEFIVRWFCRKYGINYEKKLPQKKHLYAVGSILQMGYQNATVWGSGFAFEPGVLRSFPHRSCFQKLDIRCVRGPKTRATLLRLGHDCPEVYGDPAVLMPLIYEPRVNKTIDYLVIPHYTKYRETMEQCGEERCISMNTRDYKKIIDRICSAKKVVSSSLHGIILAEAYGVPAVYYQDRPTRLGYKFADWYISTGREMWNVPSGWKNGANRDGSLPTNERIKELQNNLINSFPFDLWGSMS